MKTIITYQILKIITPEDNQTDILKEDEIINLDNNQAINPEDNETTTLENSPRAWGFTCKVVNGNVNLRASYSTSASIKTVLKQGEFVESYSAAGPIVNGFTNVRVKRNGTWVYGWASSKYIAPMFGGYSN